MKGKGAVFLVGAGPGDAGLLTLRGAELLGRADVVVYDALVNEELLRLAPKSAEIIYRGKRHEDNAIPQEELNALSGTQNRGIKQAPFRVLVGATMPAVLVETAFISNAEEEKKLGNPSFQQSVAEGIAKAVGRFFARHKPGAPWPAPTPSGQPPVAK